MNKLISQNIPVILPIEIKKREFDSRLLIAFTLAKEGVPSIIGDRSGCERELKLFNKCIYLAKSLAFSQKDLFQFIKQKSGKIFVLFEEGGFNFRPKEIKQEIESWYPKGMLPFVDIVFTYGHSFLRSLKNYYQDLDEDKVFISGNCRFDLHKPRFYEFYSDQMTLIKKKHKPYILFNCNFVLSNHYLGKMGFEKEIINNKEVTDRLRKIYIDKINLNRLLLQKFIKMIQKVSDEVKDVHFIVRPHPSESLDVYKNTFKDNNRIFITNKGSAIPWILGSEIVIHHDCTTAIESIFANKPVISFLPEGKTPDLLWLSVYLSEKTFSENDVVRLVKKYLKKEDNYKLTEEQRNVFNNEVINVTEETAPRITELVKDTIEQMKNETDYDIILKKNAISKYCAKMLDRGLSLIRWYKAKHLKKSGYAIKFEGISKKEIEKKLKILDEIHQCETQFRVNQLGVNTYYISTD
jgi:surface carbohydrate biosynthesis protein